MRFSLEKRIFIIDKNIVLALKSKARSIRRYGNFETYSRRV